MCNKIRFVFSCFFLSVLLANSTSGIAAPVYTKVGEATNDTTPSTWLDFSFDITNLVTGAKNAVLKFDLRNDAPPHIADSTTSAVSFGVENTSYFVHFDYLSGRDTSHWRNVELIIDGLHYADQYGDQNNHLGDADYGTAYQGVGFAGNLLGQTGFDATTFIMTADTGTAPVSSVPVPAAFWLFGSALLGLVSTRKKA